MVRIHPRRPLTFSIVVRGTPRPDRQVQGRPPPPQLNDRRHEEERINHSAPVLPAGRLLAYLRSSLGVDEIGVVRRNCHPLPVALQMGSKAGLMGWLCLLVQIRNRPAVVGQPVQLGNDKLGLPISRGRIKIPFRRNCLDFGYWPLSISKNTEWSLLILRVALFGSGLWIP
jgi:hypothetical protein